MPTVTGSVRATVLGLVLTPFLALATPAYAATLMAQPTGHVPSTAIPVKRLGASRQVPVVAAAGRMGERSHRQVLKEAVLAGSPRQEQMRSERLDEARRLAAQLHTDIRFRTSDTRVRDPVMAPLLRLGRLAAALPDVTIHVDGYADPRGPDVINDDLSQRRAEAVAEVLESVGVSPDQLIIEGHGKTGSLNPGNDLTGYALDRRVTLSLQRAPPQVASRE